MARIDFHKIRFVKTPNTEVTDPGVIATPRGRDEYIPPQESLSRKPAPQALAPIRWVQNIFSKRRVGEESGEIIAKIERLPDAPDHSIRYFFDNDLPRLVRLSELQPIVVHQQLRAAFEKAPNREAGQPWFRLVQVACGDASAILPALDSLC